jgi:hypothetical protein
MVALTCLVSSGCGDDDSSGSDTCKCDGGSKKAKKVAADGGASGGSSGGGDSSDADDDSSGGGSPSGSASTDDDCSSDCEEDDSADETGGEASGDDSDGTVGAAGASDECDDCDADEVIVGSGVCEECGGDCSDCTADQCESISETASASGDSWANEAQSAVSSEIRVEFLARPADAELNGLVGVSSGPVNNFSDAQLVVRFNDTGVVEVRDGEGYDSDTEFQYEADAWYHVVIEADLDARRYTVEIGPCGEDLVTLISDASFRDDSPVTQSVDNVALWTSDSAEIAIANVSWAGARAESGGEVTTATADDGEVVSGGDSPTGRCEAQTCADMGYTCGTPTDSCGNELNCGECEGGQSCIGGQCREPSAADCGSEDPAEPCMGTSATTVVDGITYSWEFTCDGGPCQVGRLLDGSPWVRHPDGGDVSIDSVTPDDDLSGLEKNPGTGDRAISREQGLYTSNGEGSEAPYNPDLDLSNQLPYLAAPDNGVYVKAKAYTEGDCGYTNAVGSNCLDSYSALVVLEELPPDGVLGNRTFRPGAAGNDKLLVTTDDLDLSSLPQLSAISSTEFSRTVSRWMAPYPDFFSGINGDRGRRWTPHARLGGQDYAAARASRNIQDTFGVLGNTPLTGTKLQAVYALAQYGMELYSAYMQGVAWAGGAGQNQGRWHPIVFFGALMRDPDVQENIRAAASTRQFTDIIQLRRNVNGIPIWGSEPGDDGCRQGDYGGHGRYWSDFTKGVLRDDDGGKRTCGDPYGYIDGPAERPGSSYARCCSSGLYINMALLMKIWPEFDDVASNSVMLEYAERIMDGAGWWVADDQCAGVDPRENMECAPYTERQTRDTCEYFGITWGYNDATQSCITIDEAEAAGHPEPGPRFPASLHLAGRPDFDRAAPGDGLWDALSGN